MSCKRNAFNDTLSIEHSDSIIYKHNIDSFISSAYNKQINNYLLHDDLNSILLVKETMLYKVNLSNSSINSVSFYEKENYNELNAPMLTVAYYSNNKNFCILLKSTLTNNSSNRIDIITIIIIDQKMNILQNIKLEVSDGFLLDDMFLSGIHNVIPNGNGFVLNSIASSALFISNNKKVQYFKNKHNDRVFYSGLDSSYVSEHRFINKNDQIDYYLYFNDNTNDTILIASKDSMLNRTLGLGYPLLIHGSLMFRHGPSYNIYTNEWRGRVLDRSIIPTRDGKNLFTINKGVLIIMSAHR